MMVNTIHNIEPFNYDRMDWYIR